MEKAKGAATGAPAKGSLKGPLATTPRAQVVRVATSGPQLTELLERFRWYKYDVMQLLIKVRSLHMVTSCGLFKVSSSSYSHSHFTTSRHFSGSLPSVMSFGQFILSHYLVTSLCHFTLSLHSITSHSHSFTCHFTSLGYFSQHLHSFRHFTCSFH